MYYFLVFQAARVYCVEYNVLYERINSTSAPTSIMKKPKINTIQNLSTILLEALPKMHIAEMILLTWPSEIQERQDLKMLQWKVRNYNKSHAFTRGGKKIKQQDSYLQVHKQTIKKITNKRS